jgi:cell division protein FtsB
VLSLRPTRLLAIGGILLVTFLYWKPLHSYVKTKHELQAQHAQVQSLRAEKARLQRRIAQATTGNQLVREARRLGLVKPGEKLYIVRGISQWRAKQKR